MKKEKARSINELFGTIRFRQTAQEIKDEIRADWNQRERKLDRLLEQKTASHLERSERSSPELKPQTLTKEYVTKAIEKTTAAIGSVGIIKEDRGSELLDMIQRYVSDSQHFLKKGNLVAAFGAVEYSHGLLDAGVLAGYFEILRNKELFVFGKEKE